MNLSSIIVGLYLIKSYPTLIYVIRAELDMTDCDGKTALHLSCSEGHYDVVVQLLRAGANVNLVNLQVSACVSSNNFSCRFPAISTFNICSLQGRTPLRIALLEGSLDIAGLLLDNAADIDYVDTDCRFHFDLIWTRD